MKFSLKLTMQKFEDFLNLILPIFKSMALIKPKDQEARLLQAIFYEVLGKVLRRMEDKQRQTQLQSLGGPIKTLLSFEERCALYLFLCEVAPHILKLGMGYEFALIDTIKRDIQVQI